MKKMILWYISYLIKEYLLEETIVDVIRHNLGNVNIIVDDYILELLDGAAKSRLEEKIFKLIVNLEPEFTVEDNNIIIDTDELYIVLNRDIRKSAENKQWWRYILD
jgi:hypothetical protein